VTFYVFCLVSYVFSNYGIRVLYSITIYELIYSMITETAVAVVKPKQKTDIQ